MDDDPEDLIRSTSRLLLQYCRDTYQHEAEDWRDIDRKAQGTVAICGIFLTAAAFSIRNLDAFSFVGQLALVALVICVLIAAWWALQALRISDLHGLESAKNVLEAAKHVIEVAGRSASDGQDEIRRFVLDLASGWSEAQKSLFKVNIKKAERIQAGQKWLTRALPIVYVMMTDAVIKEISGDSFLIQLGLWALAAGALYYLWDRLHGSVAT